MKKRGVYKNIYEGRGVPKPEPFWVKSNGYPISMFGASWGSPYGARSDFPIVDPKIYHHIIDRLINKILCICFHHNSRMPIFMVFLHKCLKFYNSSYLDAVYDLASFQRFRRPRGVKIGMKASSLITLGKVNKNLLVNQMYSNVIIRSISHRHYSSALQQPQQLLSPHWVTGFIDAEGCFTLGIESNPNYKTGWSVYIRFQIKLHVKDREILENMQTYFGTGRINKDKNNALAYVVTSIKDINKILQHLDNYPLITQKKADYILFKQIVELIQRKEHLTASPEGLKKILAMRASLNLGLSDKLKEAFPEIVAVKRPLIENKIMPDPFWFAGFASGESNFNVQISKSKNKLGEGVVACFSVSQHSRDISLIKSFVQYLGCGGSYQNSKRENWVFMVTRYKDLAEKILPFFDKYPIQGIKYQDYLDFKKVVLLMLDKAHLTPEGLDQIRLIKSKMSTRRNQD